MVIACVINIQVEDFKKNTKSLGRVFMLGASRGNVSVDSLEPNAL